MLVENWTCFISVSSSRKRRNPYLVLSRGSSITKTGTCFGGIPRAVSECPSDIGDNGHSREEVIPNVEVGSCEFGIECRSTVLTKRTPALRSKLTSEAPPCFPQLMSAQRNFFIRDEKIAAVQRRSRRVYAKTAHGPAHAVGIVRDPPLGSHLLIPC